MVKLKLCSYIDCLSKKACVIILRLISLNNIIKALDYA